MAFDNVPWAVGGGALNSPEIARVLAYASTSKTEGIISTGDLKVTALSTPGTSVNIAPGAGLIRSRATGTSNQTYVMRAPTLTNVAINATGATARTDMVVARVEDPYNVGEPWQTPADPTVGPYVFPRVLTSVPSTIVTFEDAQFWLTSQGYSAIPVAKITIPANTGTITNAMISDLRKVAQPLKDPVVKPFSPNTVVVKNNAGAARDWFPQLQQTVFCPAWATRMQIVVMISGLLVTGQVQGVVRAEFGYNGGPNFLATQDAGIHHTAATGDRQAVVIGDDIAIPPEYRNKSQFVRTGAILNANMTGSMQTDQWTNVVTSIQFVEVAE